MFRRFTWAAIPTTMKDSTFVKRALDAIDKRDGEAVEGLRGRQVDLHLAELLQTWRSTLPWAAKDLYVGLFMDQKDACLEPLMRDALDSPAVETRAAAICYLAGNFALFDTFLAAGGWVDPVPVDRAIAQWRNEVGAATARACRTCGAPYRENDLTCRYCRAPLQGAAEDPGRFSEGASAYEVRVGIPGPNDGPGELRIQNALKPGGVGFRVTVTGRAFLEGKVCLRVLLRAGPAMVEAGRHWIAVSHGDRIAYVRVELHKPGEYEAEVLASDHLLARTTFRIVH